MKRKSELSMEVVVVAILVVLFIVFGLQWTSRLFSPKLDEEVINQACYQSIQMNSNRRAPGIEIETIEPKCPTKYVTFHEDKGEYKYESNPLDTTSNRVIEDDILYRCNDDEEMGEKCMFRNINKIIADEMVRCWKNFGHGENRVFSIYKKQRQCVVCSVFFFDEDIVKNHGPKGTIGLIDSEDESYNLNLYMRNNNNIKYGSSNYYEYTLDFIDRNVDLPYYDYDVTHEYAIVFSALNKDAVKLMGNKAWDAFIGLLGEEPKDDDSGNFINTLNFIPNNEVSQICDSWA